MKTTLMLITALAGATTAHAQELADSGSFFVKLGKDTIAIERYTRNRNQLVGEAVMRTPVTRHMKLTVTFKEDGSVSWWEVINSPVPGTPNPVPVLRTLITLLGDSAQVETWAAATQRPTRKIGANKHMLPLQIPFYSTYETAIQRARRTPADSLLPMIAANAPLTYTIKYPAPDSVTLYHHQSGTNAIKLDKDGRMLRFNGEGTTFKVEVIRSKVVDLSPWATRFGKEDAEGKSFGVLSPRDTAEITIGSTVMLIDYSRPAKRGRVIFGGIVPWDQVWRTGANAATHVFLSQPIIINNTEVPPGVYTLWSIPSKRGWEIVFNKQTKQWGTIYDPAQDLLRAPAIAESIPVPREIFTIEGVDKGNFNGELILTWDRTRVRLPFKAKQ